MTEDKVAEAGRINRRALLAGAAVAAAGALLPAPAVAAPEDLAVALKALLGEAKLQTGRVLIELPALADNGNSVPITVLVASPMTAADHVKTIHVLAEKNPLANIARFHLGPRAGRARVQTNIRLALTQTVTVVAEMSDGSFWASAAETIVTAAACLEDT